MAEQRWVEHTVAPDEAGRTVEQILTGPLGISRRMIQKLTRGRGILRNRRPPFLGAKVRPGDVVAARVGFAEESGLKAVPMELDIVHEDAEVLVVNKPPFVLVHPTAPDHRETISHGIAWHLEQQGRRTKVRPVHRIDRDTSGLVLFAKTAIAHQRLDRELREGGVRRRYLALVAGAIDDGGVIEARIARDPRRPHLRIVKPNGDEARTRFEVIERFPSATLVQLELETGRTHQIRVHLAHIDHPVLGDRQYGRAELGLLPRQALHASGLAFPHPSGAGEITCESPLPDDMLRLVAQLRAEH